MKLFTSIWTRLTKGGKPSREALATTVMATPSPIAVPLVTPVSDLLASVLREFEIAFTANPEAIVLANGIALEAKLTKSRALESGAVRVVTCIRMIHPQRFPDGISEFQHALGKDVDDAIENGFRSWVKVDLLVLADSLLHTPKASALLKPLAQVQQVSVPAHRRVLLGEPVHFVTSSDVPLPASQSGEHHPFCPCCMVTRCMEVLEDQLADDGFHAIRLFAARDAHGEISADCRINGVDFPEAAEVLKQYAADWPDRGLEYRKQLVVIQNQPVAID
ncbi:hypothetical protein KSF73_04230 [Burkholderiaceae bacterium DAT-1]|nr:hypothetical protein [Burkholderiaceae bacterium DAT-1]